MASNQTRAMPASPRSPEPGALAARKSRTFILLFGLEALCRALVVTLLPQLAYGALGNAFWVSLLYLAANAAGLVASLMIPSLLNRVARRWLITAGSIGHVVAALMFASGEPEALIAGLIVQAFAIAVMEMMLSLYMLEHIPRRQLSQFEPRRLLLTGSAFIAGPWLGVVLHHQVLHNLTFALVAATVLIELALFWRFRMVLGQPGSAGPPPPPPSPLTFVPRFARQPRLLLAWMLAVGRNGWWVMYMVYTPILVSRLGYGPEVGGALVSAGLAPMLLVGVWGALGRRYGLRWLLFVGYAMAGLASIATGLLAAWPEIALALLLVSALGATVVDGGGNVPFMRAVHPHERAAMTAVFLTYRNMSAIALPALFALVLVWLPLPAVFVTGGLVALAMAALSLFIPRRM